MSMAGMSTTLAIATTRTKIRNRSIVPQLCYPWANQNHTSLLTLLLYFPKHLQWLEFRNVAETCASTKMQARYSQRSQHSLAVRHFSNYRQPPPSLDEIAASPSPQQRVLSVAKL
jgi:hypothetical protein